MDEPWFRSVNTTLSQLEKGMCDLYRAMGTIPVDGCEALHRVQNDLAMRQQDELRRVFHKTRALLCDIKRTLRLPGNSENLSKLIWAWSWAMRGPVTELEPKYLKAYGGAPQELCDYLQKCVARLERILIRITEISSADGKTA